MWWDKYELRDKSRLVELFYLQTKITTKCPKCGYINNTYERSSQLTLPLPLPKKKGKCNLQDCLSLLTLERESETME